ncbi:hypothetical protein REPUB_Repub02eG0043100 [Reevesia pubescens]
MWNEMEKICMKHVKPGDFIYFSGYLGSFSKANEDTQRLIYYQPNMVKDQPPKYKELESEQGVDEEEQVINIGGSLQGSYKSIASAKDKEISLT